MLNQFSSFSRNTQPEVTKYFSDSFDSSLSDVAIFDPDKLRHIEETSRRWSWVEIDLNAIRHNIMQARALVGRNVRLLGVVKADAYGHGAVRVAKTALNSGVDYLAVATVNEAIELREALVNAPILVLSQPPKEAIPLLLAYKIMPSVYTADFAITYGEAAEACGVSAPFHLAINTGMNRIGVRYDEANEFMHSIVFHRALQVKGIFTHFATADCADTLDFQLQYKRFTQCIADLRQAGYETGIVHCANSAATMRYPETHFDMARWGVAMYGAYPSKECQGIVQLKQAMSVRARITDVRSLPVSEGVSYGLHYRSRGSVKICTIPLGYADGYSRLLSGRADVLIQGVRCRQVGNICMDQCMVEVDMRSSVSRARLEPQIGDEVTLLGACGDDFISLDELADKAETISYELACSFGMRLPKIYV